MLPPGQEAHRVERASRVPRASSQIARVEGHSPRRSVRSLVTTARDSRATTVTDGANPSIWSNGLRASPSTACPFELPNYVVGRAATKQAAGLLVGTVWPQVSTSCTSFAVATVGCMSARSRRSGGRAQTTARGAAFTAARRPVSLIYFEGYSSRREAMERDLQVKQWSAAKKSALVAGDLEQVHRSSRCRQRRCK